MSVALLDLKAQYASLATDIDRALRSVVESQHFILGPTARCLSLPIYPELPVHQVDRVAQAIRGFRGA